MDMPDYKYLCAACGHEWNQFQEAGVIPITECPACKKNRARRLWSPKAHPDTAAENSPSSDDGKG